MILLMTKIELTNGLSSEIS